MSVFNRAFRNIWRKNVRTLLVVCALAFSIAAIVSVQAGVDASTSDTQAMIDGIVADTEEMVSNTTTEYKALIENVQQDMEDVGNVTDLQLRQIQLTSSSFRPRDENGSFPGPGNGGEPPEGGGFPGGGGFVQPDPINDSMIDAILSIEGVEGVVPTITQRVGESFRQPDYNINGVPLDYALNEKYQFLPTIIEGRQLAENDSVAVVINSNLKTFFNASVGDIVDIEGVNFTIVGTSTSTVSFFGSNVYMSISDAQTITDLNSDEYSGLYVYAVNESVTDAVAYDIEELYLDYRAMTMGDFGAMPADMIERMQERQLIQLQDEKNATIAQLEEDMNTQVAQLDEDMEGITNTGNQIIIVSAITAGLIVLFMMFYTVRERIREIGTLKAIGFTGGNVMSQFIMEGTLIGFIGGLVGIVIALVAAPFLSDALLPNSEAFSSSGISPFLILVALGMTALLGALGSLYPAWNASRKSPVEAMRH